MLHDRMGTNADGLAKIMNRLSTCIAAKLLMLSFRTHFYLQCQHSATDNSTATS